MTPPGLTRRLFRHPAKPDETILILDYRDRASHKFEMDMIDPPKLRMEEQDHIEAARNWVKGHFSRDPEQSYEGLEGKLHVIDTILRNDWVEQNETWKLQALGIAFGDALAQKLMLDWVTVDDEFGCNPALNWPGTSIYSYPATMISKRVERGEQIDVRELFDDTCSTLCEMAFSGRYI